jgi:hypothetical protein
MMLTNHNPLVKKMQSATPADLSFHSEYSRSAATQPEQEHHVKRNFILKVYKSSSSTLAMFGRLFFWLISRLWLICCERKILFHG